MTVPNPAMPLWSDEREPSFAKRAVVMGFALSLPFLTAASVALWWVV